MATILEENMPTLDLLEPLRLSSPDAKDSANKKALGKGIIEGSAAS